MPELPEVETMRRGILAIEGCSISGIEWPRCRLRPIATVPGRRAFARRAIGQTILQVDRWGKRVVLRLDSDDALILEPRMSGLVLLSHPPGQEHLRLRIRLSGGRMRQLLFWDRRGLGSVRLLGPSQWKKVLGPDRLGPDALTVTADQLRSVLKNSRRAVKVALLDQRAVAGIGNLYAAEILHAAGIHPQRRCDSLTRHDWHRLREAIVEVLEQAIRFEGSTLSDGTYRNALNQSGQYQNHHRVYQREDQLCPTCTSGKVQRIIQAQRSTFFCPTCQPRRGVRRNA